VEALEADDTRRWLRAVPAVQTRGPRWAPQAPREAGRVRRRAAHARPPARARGASPDAPAAHDGHQRTTTWTGYTGPLSARGAPPAPHLSTQVATTAASPPEVPLTAPLHAARAATARLPSPPVVDAGAIAATRLVSSPTQPPGELVGPVRTEVRWPARARQGADLSACRVDGAAQTATCPAGPTRVTWQPGHARWGTAVSHLDWQQRHGRPGPDRSFCPHATHAPRDRPLTPRAAQAARLTVRARRRRTGRPRMPSEPAVRAPVRRAFGRSRGASHATGASPQRLGHLGPPPRPCIACAWLPGGRASPRPAPASPGLPPDASTWRRRAAGEAFATGISHGAKHVDPSSAKLWNAH
jgi:hypothetical protein